MSKSMVLRNMLVDRSVRKSASTNNFLRRRVSVRDSGDVIVSSMQLGMGPSLTGSFDLMPAAAVAGFALLAGAAKFAAYSQLEVVRTAMLSRHITSSGARVVLLGELSTRDLYYLPSSTIQATVVGKDINAGLFEQAGVQASVPVCVLKQSTLAALASMQAASADSVVAFEQLNNKEDLPHLLNLVLRVLKPGGTFIFLQRVRGSPLALRLGASPAADADIGDVIANSELWESCQWDLAAAALDPTAVGVAIKPESISSENFSVDKQAFEQVMKSKGGIGAEGKKGFGKGA